MGVIEYSVIFILGLAMFFMFAKIHDDKKYVFLCMFVLFLVAALRHESVGGDIVNYITSYEQYAKYSLKEILELYITDDFKDPTYYLTGWLFSRIFHNPQWWLAFVAFAFCGTLGRLIYKESKVPALSIIALMALGFYSFSMTGLRQTLAIVLVVFSYEPLKERKLILFVLLVFAASLYHQTALIFLMAYPIVNVEIGKYHLIAAAVVFIIFFAFQSQLLEFMNTFLQEERYEGYTSGDASQLTISGFIIQAAIFVYAIFYYKTAVKDNKEILVLYNLSFIGLMFQLYSSFIAEMFRISMYFSVFNVLLIPNVSVCEKRHSVRTGVQLLLFLALLINLFKNGASYYKFFWESII